MSKGSIHNQRAFLDHVAGSLGRARRRNVKRPMWKHQPQKNVYEGLKQDELISIFEQACEAIHTQIKKTNVDQLTETLEMVVSDHGGGPIVASDEDKYTQFGLEPFLKNSGDVHIWNSERGRENVEIAEKANIGVSFSDITLAESGTVVLFNDKRKARSISLLPRTYIAIIPKSTLVQRFTQASRGIHEEAVSGRNVATCVNLITGPSNSADIEMNLVVGVHGPVKVSYIVVTDK